MTGICREVLRWYSPNPGAMATRSANMRSRSSPSASRALTSNVSVPVAVPTSTRAMGFAFEVVVPAGVVRRSALRCDDDVPLPVAVVHHRRGALASAARPHRGEQYELVPERSDSLPSLGMELLDGRVVPVRHRYLLTFVPRPLENRAFIVEKLRERRKCRPSASSSDIDRRVHDRDTEQLGQLRRRNDVLEEQIFVHRPHGLYLTRLVVNEEHRRALR